MKDFWLVSLSLLLVSSSFPSPQQTLEIQKLYLFSYVFWGFKFLRYAVLQQYPLRYGHLGDQLWSIIPKLPHCSVVSDSLQPHGLQHTKPPCPSPIPGVYSNSRPLSQWCHPTISSSVVPFSSHFRSFPAQGLFQWVSSSHQVAKILEFQLQHQSLQWIFRTDFFRMDWLDLLAVQGTLVSLLQHHSSEASILRCLAFFIVQLSHPYMTTGKTIALTRWTFVGEVMSLLFNMLSKLVITFLPRSRHLLISWLQSPPAVIWSPPK